LLDRDDPFDVTRLDRDVVLVAASNIYLWYVVAARHAESHANLLELCRYHHAFE